MAHIIVFQNSIRTVATFRLPYIQKLVHLGHQVTVISRNDCPASALTLLNSGCAVQLVSSSSIFRLFLHFNVCYFFHARNFRSDHIFVLHFVSSLVLLSFALLIFRPCKVVVSIEGLGSWAVSPLRRAFLRFLLNLEGIVSTVCNRDEQQAVGNARTFLINGIGVNLVDFDFTINEHRRRNVLFVGRLIRDKGILDFFRLVELSIAKGLDIKFVVVGDVYANNPSSLTADEIDNFAALYGSFIEFVGYQHDVRHFFDDALCLVLPSSREGFPVVVMEASASGVPALVYNVPGSLDSVQEGINGFIVDFGMVERLFDTILWLRNLDLVKYQDLQCSCRSYALDNFDEESYVLRFLNVVLR